MKFINVKLSIREWHHHPIDPLHRASPHGGRCWGEWQVGVTARSQRDSARVVQQLSSCWLENMLSLAKDSLRFLWTFFCHIMSLCYKKEDIMVMKSLLSSLCLPHKSHQISTHGTPRWTAWTSRCWARTRSPRTAKSRSWTRTTMTLGFFASGKLWKNMENHSVEGVNQWTQRLCSIAKTDKLYVYQRRVGCGVSWRMSSSCHVSAVGWSRCVSPEA